MRGLAGVSDKLHEELLINLVGSFRSQPEFQCFEHIEQLLKIDELYRWHPVPDRFPLGFRCECTCRENDALVGPSHHRAPKVSHLIWAN